MKSQTYLFRHRENTRGRIALILVGLLALVVLTALAGLLLLGASPSDIKELLATLLSPLVALAGTATGFYFGSAKPGTSR